MEVAAVHLARAVAMIEPIDLNPGGKAYYPDIASALVRRYNFQKFPQRPEEFDETKGITFAAGKFDRCVIEQVTIYPYGILLDTRVSTNESKRLLEDALQWGQKELGLAKRQVTRWQYVSQLTFYSKVPITDAGMALQTLSDGVAKGVSQVTGESLHYEVTAIFVDYDQLTRKHPMGRFSIQRRENTPFSENKYFSDAPLATDLHIELLEKFEANLARK